MNQSVTALAHPNIALIKYWGNRDHKLRLPSNGSISMNLAALETRSTVMFLPDLRADELILNGKPQKGAALSRVKDFMEVIRNSSGICGYAHIVSHNNFPASAGLASSASAFAALAVAGAAACGLDYSEKQLSRLARRGSGSAARSIPGGFVEWLGAPTDEGSYAFSIALADHWELWDCVALVSQTTKQTGSTEGHLLANTSMLQPARVSDAPRRLDLCRSAILHQDFAALAELIELDSHMLHAVMLTSRPSLLYWEPSSVSVMKAIASWRRQGIEAAFTLDAGPNVHVICTAAHAQIVTQKLKDIPGVAEVLASPVGEGARIIRRSEISNTI